MRTFSWVGGDLIVRIGAGLVVVALTVGGSMGAAFAQTYYPPPPDDYDYPVPAHGRAPVPPGNVGAPVPAYPPGYAQPAPPAQSPPGRAYYGYPDQTAGQSANATLPAGYTIFLDETTEYGQTGRAT